MKCTQCSPGQFNPYEIATSCTDCPAGSVAGERGAAECSECGGGSVAGEDGLAECTECTPGYYSVERTQCAPCAPGSLTMLPGPVSVNSVIWGELFEFQSLFS